MILKTLLILAIATVAVLTIVALFAATKPNALQVERSVTIDAPAEKIFPLLNDFHNWPNWAPQDKEDPTMTRTYSGAPSGLGAVSNWDSKGTAGKGKMTITESTAPNKVVVTVDFVRPWKLRNINEFVLQPGTPVKVTWTFHGSNHFVMKFMSVFVSMDKVIGKHFETGLNNLKQAAEK
jgi:uncharacterized protein YndB with AHSA1/START domain